MLPAVRTAAHHLPLSLGVLRTKAPVLSVDITTSHLSDHLAEVRGARARDSPDPFLKRGTLFTDDSKSLLTRIGVPVLSIGLLGCPARPGHLGQCGRQAGHGHPNTHLNNHPYTMTSWRRDPPGTCGLHNATGRSPSSRPVPRLPVTMDYVGSFPRLRRPRHGSARQHGSVQVNHVLAGEPRPTLPTPSLAAGPVRLGRPPASQHQDAVLGPAPIRAHRFVATSTTSATRPEHSRTRDPPDHHCTDRSLRRTTRDRAPPQASMHCGAYVFARSCRCRPAEHTRRPDAEPDAVRLVPGWLSRAAGMPRPLEALHRASAKAGQPSRRWYRASHRTRDWWPASRVSRPS